MRGTRRHRKKRITHIVAQERATGVMIVDGPLTTVDHFRQRLVAPIVFLGDHLSDAL
jgi:hypothetical protein